VKERQPAVAGEWKATEVKGGDEEIQKTKQKSLDQAVLDLRLVQTPDARE
jgi:hypothetical protein